MFEKQAALFPYAVSPVHRGASTDIIDNPCPKALARAGRGRLTREQKRARDAGEKAEEGLRQHGKDYVNDVKGLLRQAARELMSGAWGDDTPRRVGQTTDRDGTVRKKT